MSGPFDVYNSWRKSANDMDLILKKNNPERFSLVSVSFKDYIKASIDRCKDNLLLSEIFKLELNLSEPSSRTNAESVPAESIESIADLPEKELLETRALLRPMVNVEKFGIDVFHIVSFIKENGIIPEVKTEDIDILFVKNIPGIPANYMELSEEMSRFLTEIKQNRELNNISSLIDKIKCSDIEKTKYLQITRLLHSKRLIDLYSPGS
jgi:hypothetical protein